MDEKKKSRPDKPGNSKKILMALYAVCVLLLAVDLFLEKYGHFEVEEWIGFHAWYGFAACVVLVLAARGLRVILGRKEDYYD